MRHPADAYLPISDLRGFARRLVESPGLGLTFRSSFGVHEIYLDVVCDSQVVADAFRLVLRFFENPEPRGQPPGAYIVARSTAAEVLRSCIPKGARAFTVPVEPAAAERPDGASPTPAVTASPPRYHQLGDIRYYDTGRGAVVALDPASQTAVAYVDPSQSSGPEDIAGAVVRCVLTELLAAGGRHLVPATAVAWDDRAVILAGPPGVGKTTACVALMRAGFRFLSDDAACLDYRVGAGPSTSTSSPTPTPAGGSEQEVRVLCFPSCARVHDETLQAFPELCSISPIATNLGARLHSLFFDDIYPGCVVPRAVPGLVLFPERGRGAFHAVRPLDPAVAAARMLAQCPPLMDSGSRRRRREAIRLLCGLSACYDLELGWDFPSLAPLLRTLIAGRADAVP